MIQRPLLQRNWLIRHTFELQFISSLLSMQSFSSSQTCTCRMHLPLLRHLNCGITKPNTQAVTSARWTDSYTEWKLKPLPHSLCRFEGSFVRLRRSDSSLVRHISDYWQCRTPGACCWHRIWSGCPYMWTIRRISFTNYYSGSIIKVRMNMRVPNTGHVRSIRNFWNHTKVSLHSKSLDHDVIGTDCQA